MSPLLIGAAQAVLPSVIDIITGASGNARKAREAQDSQLAEIMNRIRGEMGNSAADSTYYKTLMAQADKSYNRQSNANNQYAAASGASDEAKLGQLSEMNDGYNTQQLNTLSAADQQRRQLQSQWDSVAAQRAALGVGNANQGLANQSALTGGAMSLLGSMFGPGRVQPDGDSIYGGGGSSINGGGMFSDKNLGVKNSSYSTLY